MRICTIFATCVASILWGRTAFCDAQVGDARDEAESAYRNAIDARVDRIVQGIGLADPSQRKRLHRLVATQYFELRKIHDARDAQIAETKQRFAAEVDQVERRVEAIVKSSQLAQFRLHRTFVSQLAAELTEQQVGLVKDGMTYGVTPATYNRYLQLLPGLKEEEKKIIKGMLLEAREYAMDAGSSEEKHGWFRNYKGKINNYLSSAGYDLREAERRLQEQ